MYKNYTSFLITGKKFAKEILEIFLRGNYGGTERK